MATFTLIKHKDSHVDHGLTELQLSYILGMFANIDRSPILGLVAPPIMKLTIELPEWLGTVPCALRGPTVGDEPMTKDHSDPRVTITPAKRGTRSYDSRMVNIPPTQTRQVTVIAGPHDGHELVLFTAYGGPIAPREVGELVQMLSTNSIVDAAALTAELEESRAFWATHALALVSAPFTWTVEMTVDETWVADGFELTDRRALSMLAHDLTGAYGHELHAKVLRAPDPETIAIAQGYKSAADKAEREARK